LYLTLSSKLIVPNGKIYYHMYHNNYFPFAMDLVVNVFNIKSEHPCSILSILVEYIVNRLGLGFSSKLNILLDKKCSRAEVCILLTDLVD